MKRNLITPPGKTNTINVELITTIIRAFAFILLAIMVAILIGRNVSGKLSQDTPQKDTSAIETYAHTSEDISLGMRSDL